MRILFLSNYYPPFEVGGYEQLCRDVAVRLQDRGHEIAVLTSDRGKEQYGALAEPGVFRLLRIQPNNEMHLSIAMQFFLTRNRAEKYNRCVFLMLLKQVNPDIIFIWNLQGLPQELSLDAEASELPVAYWLAGYSPAEPDLFWRFWDQQPQLRIGLAGFKRVIAKIAFAQMRHEGKPVRPEMSNVSVVSNYMRSYGIEQGTLAGHPEIIYNGIEVNDFYRPVPPVDSPPPVRILIAGRVTPDKGIHVAVEALGMVSLARPQRDFRLIIAGDGSPNYIRQLKNLISFWHVEDLIEFSGWMPREEIPSLMHSCQILLHSAIHPEAFARVILEGMAAGLAVVGTLTGGTGELLIERENGLTCAAENSHEMAEKIEILLDDPAFRFQLACNGQKRVIGEFSLDRMVDRLENFLKRAVAEHGDA